MRNKAMETVDLEAASKLALASLRQMPTDALLVVNAISKRGFRDGKFDWTDAKTCDNYRTVGDLLSDRCDADALGVVDGLLIVAVEHTKLNDDNEDYVCLRGVRGEF